MVAATRYHSSSVTNGTSGCSSRNAASTYRARFVGAWVLSGLWLPSSYLAYPRLAPTGCSSWMMRKTRGKMTRRRTRKMTTRRARRRTRKMTTISTSSALLYRTFGMGGGTIVHLREEDRLRTYRGLFTFLGQKLPVFLAELFNHGIKKHTHAKRRIPIYLFHISNRSNDAPKLKFSFILSR